MLCVYMCACLCMCVYMCVDKRLYAYVCLCVCVLACACLCLYLCIHVCVCAYVCFVCVRVRVCVNDNDNDNDNLLIPMSPCQVLGININDLHSNNLQWLKKKNCVHIQRNNFCILVKKLQYITRITNLVFHSNKNEEEQKTCVYMCIHV